MNVDELEKRMKNADWFYDYTEDHDVWLRGNLEIEGIKKDLQHLCQSNGGKTTANALWDEFVPEFSISKPSFLEWQNDLERRMDSYDWSLAFYDPLHDFIESDTEEAKQEHAAMETLIEDLQQRHKENPGEVMLLVNKYWKDQPMENQINLLVNQVNENVMNEENLKSLHKSLGYLGLGDKLNGELTAKIEAKSPDFILQHEVEYNQRTMKMDLSFRAGDRNDMYFLNNYQATMKDQPERTQNFDLSHGNFITSKEAFNLLEGRAVNKDLKNREGEKYNAWVQLDFNAEKDKYNNHKLDRFHSNYNYDVAREVQTLILKPRSAEEETNLLASLKKGNVQSVTFLKEGEEVKGFIEANPKERTINIYDGKMKPLTEEKKQEFMDLPPARQQSAKQSTGGEDEEGGGPELKKKRTRKQGNGQSV